MEFEKLALAWSEIEKTSSMLEMTRLLAEFFKTVPLEDVDKIVYLSQGSIAPPYKGVDLGMGEKLAETALAKSSGYSKENVALKFRETGDLGLVAEELLTDKRQASLFSKKLTVKNVYDSFYKIATSSGTGSQDTKVKGLEELFNNATPLEARYLARFPLGELRLGIRDATILNALSVKETGKKDAKQELEDKYNLHPDLGEIARLVHSKGIEGVRKIRIELGTPIRSALCERLPSAEEILEKAKGKVAVEGKYDGFRLQCHKKGNQVTLFSRQMEDMTIMFPEIVKGILEHVKAKDAIIDAEALAYDENTKQFHPFQTTMQRRRKHKIEEMAKKYPLKLFLFDALYLDGKSLISTPYEERRKQLEKTLKPGDTLLLSERIIARKPKELSDFFQACIERGLEGIIAKRLDSPYTPGHREFAWIKLKRDYQQTLGDTIDATIIGYYKGRGMRTQFGLGGLLVAVYSPERDQFLTVSKIGTGFSEELLKQLAETLGKTTLKHKPASVESLEEPDEWVQPKFVVTVKAAEITRSSLHTCKRDFEEEGYALRFPRIIGGIREDKKPEDSTTVEEIAQLFNAQKQQRTAFRTGETEEKA